MKAKHHTIRFGAIFLALLSITACARVAAEDFDLEVDKSELVREKAAPVVSFAPVLERAKPAVVSVYTAKIVRVSRGGRMSPEEEFLRRFFGLPAPQQRAPQDGETEERRMAQGFGSGVIVREDGYIVTNNHVVTDERGEDADEVLVQLNDGRELEAEIVGRDPRTDVAILKVDAENLPAIQIADSENIKVGDVVFAIGNPLGVGLTVTQGIVSATGRAIGIYGREGYEDFIQTDASINPGNSGGALVDGEGRLVGINSAILSRTGGNIGIGFAIPSGLVVNISKSLVNFGEVRRGFLGIGISDLNPDLAEAFDMEDADGVVVDYVEEDFPADKAGIERGDVITRIDGRRVENANELRLVVSQTAPGTEIEITYVRDGEEMTTTARVVDQENSLAGMGSELIEGVAVTRLSDDFRDRYGVPDDINGLGITEIDPSSPYARALRPGMVVIEINGRPVDRLSEARDALRRGANRLYVFDRGRTGYYAIRIP